jgi:hypothetical protein
MLTLKTVLDDTGLDLGECLLIRHRRLGLDAMARDEVREETAAQGVDFDTPTRAGRRWWVVFVPEGGSGTKARFCAVYENRRIVARDGAAPLLFDLADTDVLADLRGRLVVEWSGARSWVQPNVAVQAAKHRIVAIQAEHIERFPGFDEIVLSFDQLQAMVADPVVYAEWHTALRSVAAVYVITDTGTGKQYVGSAYGQDGLFGRWAGYATTGHNDNLELRALVEGDPDAVTRFRFSILRDLSLSTPPERVIAAEQAYKRKLDTFRPHGLNAN